MWLKCQGPGLYSLFGVRRQWPACVVELQIMANSDLDLFEEKRKKNQNCYFLMAYGSQNEMRSWI